MAICIYLFIRDLPIQYLIASFWSGQEGTFLLWLLLGSIYGLIIIWQRPQQERWILGMMVLIQLFLVTALILKNPFGYVWHSYPQLFQTGVIPTDGRGLNPLLQNPWMIIHPPILFTGFSSTMIIFSYAMAALFAKDPDIWIKEVYPYTIFTALSLGTGIILGGYWAYVTLGWGGYWGWDPVENSSFIPWLLSLGLIHGLLIQRHQGGLKRTNILLGLSTFLLVLYGSLLTRSGMLEDFSVHSFSKSELSTFLILFLLFFLSITIIVFLIRSVKLETVRVFENLLSKETFILFGILSLLLIAIFTLIGMSSPLISGWFLKKAAAVSITYYRWLNVPVALLAGIFISLSPLLNWKVRARIKLKTVSPYILFAVIIGFCGYYSGMHDLVPLLLLVTFVTVLSVNTVIVFKLIKEGNRKVGGYLSHVGIGLMMIGIITSSYYDRTTQVVLPLNTSLNFAEYKLCYRGFYINANGKDEAVIEIQRSNGSTFQVYPRFYWSNYSQAYMRHPAVHNLWYKDLYFSPIELIPADFTLPKDTLLLRQNISRQYKGYELIFKDYELLDHDTSFQKIYVAAVLNIRWHRQEFILKPALLVQGGLQRSVAAVLPDSSGEIYINRINLNEHTLEVGIKNRDVADTAQTQKQNVEMLAVEIMEKPLIGILWTGTVVLIAGLIVTLIYRIKTPTT